MHAEQYKLLDTLIMLEARSVVTHYKSLGGLFLNEFRHLLFKGEKTVTRVQTQVPIPAYPCVCLSLRIPVCAYPWTHIG